MPRNVSSATTSPPNAITNVLPRNAWTYGAAERIHCTNARIVAECAAGLYTRDAGASVKVAWQRGAADYSARSRVAHGRGGADRL